MKKYRSAAISLLLAASLVSLCTQTVMAQENQLSAFSQESGTDSLSTGDEYAIYQWALQNNGQLTRTERQLDIQSLEHIYADQEKGGTNSISLPPLGPSNFNSSVTESVKGIDINIQDAWNFYAQAENKRPVIVAVIDTGIDITHPDLSSSIWINSDEIPGDGIDNDNNGFIDDVNGWNFVDQTGEIFSGPKDSHGTHVAGTISAARDNGGIVGITDNQYIKLMSLKVLDGDGKSSPERVAAAIRYAEANGASICNLSFGSRGYNEELDAVIRDSNMLFIAAAGNGNMYEIGYNIDQFPVYPASFSHDNVLSVANMMFNGQLEESSNYGPYSVDIAAPGFYILSTVPGDSYGFMSGTSMAVPMVTGAAAMLYSARPDLSLLEVKQALMDSAHKLAPLKGRVLSSGMLDVSAAMAWSKPQ